MSKKKNPGAKKKIMIKRIDAIINYMQNSKLISFFF